MAVVVVLEKALKGEVGDEVRVCGLTIRKENICEADS
jgi:hypothetical protein